MMSQLVLFSRKVPVLAWALFALMASSCGGGSGNQAANDAAVSPATAVQVQLDPVLPAPIRQQVAAWSVPSGVQALNQPVNLPAGWPLPVFAVDGSQRSVLMGYPGGGDLVIGAASTAEAFASVLGSRPGDQAFIASLRASPLYAPLIASVQGALDAGQRPLESMEVFAAAGRLLAAVGQPSGTQQMAMGVSVALDVPHSVVSSLPEGSTMLDVSPRVSLIQTSPESFTLRNHTMVEWGVYMSSASGGDSAARQKLPAAEAFPPSRSETFTASTSPLTITIRQDELSRKQNVKVLMEEFAGNFIPSGVGDKVGQAIDLYEPGKSLRDNLRIIWNAMFLGAGVNFSTVYRSNALDLIDPLLQGVPVAGELSDLFSKVQLGLLLEFIPLGFRDHSVTVCHSAASRSLVPCPTRLAYEPAALRLARDGSASATAGLRAFRGDTAVDLPLGLALGASGAAIQLAGTTITPQQDGNALVTASLPGLAAPATLSVTVGSQVQLASERFVVTSAEGWYGANNVTEACATSKLNSINHTIDIATLPSQFQGLFPRDPAATEPTHWRLLSEVSRRLPAYQFSYTGAAADAGCQCRVVVQSPDPRLQLTTYGCLLSWNMDRVQFDAASNTYFTPMQFYSPLSSWQASAPFGLVFFNTTVGAGPVETGLGSFTSYSHTLDFQRTFGAPR